MPHRPPPSYRPYPRQAPRDPQDRPGRRAAQQLLDVGERFAGVLIDVAAEAVTVGVREAVDTVLGRAQRAAGQAAETIGRARRARRGDPPGD